MVEVVVSAGVVDGGGAELLRDKRWLVSLAPVVGLVVNDDVSCAGAEVA